MVRSSDGIALALLALAGCQGASADATPPRAAPLAVTVSITSATLAEDCGPPVVDAPAGAAPTAPPAHTAKQRAPAPGDSDQLVSKGERACRQTAVQLALASADGAPSTFVIARAQLFDVASGKLLQELTTRNPQLWTAAQSRYQAWDRVVKPRSKLQVTYDMTAPDWSKAGGPRTAQGKSFRLVLTVRVGLKEMKIESVVQSAELMMEPDVMT